jgi:hypothetical protein
MLYHPIFTVWETPTSMKQIGWSCAHVYLYSIASICVYLSIYIYLYLSISIYIYLYLCISIYIYLYLSISIYIYLYLSLSIYIYLYLSKSIDLSIYRPDDFLRCRQDLLEATHKGPVKREVTEWVMRESDLSGNGLLSGGHQGGITKEWETLP